MRVEQGLHGHGEISLRYKEKFAEFIADDLDTPQALALLHTLLADTALPAADKFNDFRF